VFERFTDRARRVIVLAQEEARMLNHNYIGTEHVLLGLIHEGEGIAARALGSLGISLDSVRDEITEIIGQGQSVPAGHIPFTPRAKKVLELSLRESIELGHNYIGTEHLLLGLLAEGEGVGAQVLAKMGATLTSVRSEVLKLLEGYVGKEAVSMAGGGRVETVTREPPSTEAEPADWPVCPRCRRPLEETVGYRVLDVPAAAGESEARAVAFAFCQRCGTWLGTIA
jgi:ATP-dependent Clp protease ATP-binding subunit ClpC